jgi:tRNA-dihydrouridine synthase C
MQLALAPMEGLVDHILRDVLTRVGGIDWCVTEFVRVNDRLLPPSCFHKLAPELVTGARTRTGTPMRVQLLGSDPSCLADNAALACTLGAPVIDLNFGCPAKTVNKSRGGAVLLKEPELLYRILCEVRRAVPAQIPVTAKMRLGFDSPDGIPSAPTAAPRNSSCMRAPRPMATSRRRTGNGWRGCGMQ